MVAEKKNNIHEEQDKITSDKARNVFDTEAQSKLQEAHNAIVHPDQFADVFCKAAGTQIKVKEIIRDEIKQAITYDTEARKSLKGVIKELEKEEFWIIGKRMGFAVWSLIMLALGAIITTMIGKYIK